MQKIRKILRAVSEKTVLPTNQPTNYYQQQQFCRTSLMPLQKNPVLKGGYSCNIWNKHSKINVSPKKS